MMSRALLWWMPATLIAGVALVQAAQHVYTGHKAEAAPVANACASAEVLMDMDGDGRNELVRLVRIDGDAWADVYSADGNLRSSTRVGRWREPPSISAVDANGDGRMDLVRRWSERDTPYAQVWLAVDGAFEEGWQGPVSRLCVASSK
jgi:hypothetical protein